MNENYNKNYDNVTSNLLKIHEIRTDPFYILIKKRDHKIFVVTIKNIKKTFKSKFYIDSRFFVLEEYHDLIDIFKKKFANKLPPHRVGWYGAVVKAPCPEACMRSGELCRLCVRNAQLTQFS